MNFIEGSLLVNISKGVVKYQNKFIKHYNNSDNKITATSELNSIKEGLNILSFDEDNVLSKLNALEQFLNYEIKSISENDILNGDITKPKTDQEEYKRLQEIKFDLVDRISEDIEVGNLILKPRKAQELWQDITNEFYKISKHKEHRQKVLFFLDSIYDDAVRRNKKITIDMVLEIVLEEIYFQEFPQELQIMNQEEAKLRTVTQAIGNPELKKNKWIAPEGFYSCAIEVAQNNPNFSQRGIYEQLMDEFYSNPTDENPKPSFITVWRRLKKKKII